MIRRALRLLVSTTWAQAGAWLFCVRWNHETVRLYEVAPVQWKHAALVALLVTPLLHLALWNRRERGQ